LLGKVKYLISFARVAGLVFLSTKLRHCLTFIVAKVYRDKRRLDGKDTVVIDYSKTSIIAKLIRDEIREIEPGAYLGKVRWGKTRFGFCSDAKRY